GVAASISSLVGNLAGDHLVSSQSPPVIHSFFASLLVLCWIRRANSSELAASFKLTATYKMHVRIVEARQDQLAARINDLCRRASPGFDFAVRANCYDSISQNSDGLGRGITGIHGPDFGVGND